MAFTVTGRRGGPAGLTTTGRPAAVRLERRRQKFGAVFFVALVVAMLTSAAVGLGLSRSGAPGVVAAPAALPGGQGLAPGAARASTSYDRLGLAGRAGVDRAPATRGDVAAGRAVTVAAAPTTPAPSASFSGLRLGVASSDVSVWQAQMRARGWPLQVDGVFGQRSDAVARAFQHEKGLQVDGFVGVETWTAAWTSPVT